MAFEKQGDESSLATSGSVEMGIQETHRDLPLLYDLNIIKEAEHRGQTVRILEGSTAQLLVRTLEALGVRSAFGIPGGGIAGFFYELDHSKKIDVILTQHEGGAAYMAMGRSLMSGRDGDVGLCFGTSGPGITNLLSGVAAAFEERLPLLVITGNVATRLRGKGAAQDAFSTGIDAVKLLSTVTVSSELVENGREAVQKLISLFHLALRERRPVHLNLPVDIGSEKVSISETDWMNWIISGREGLELPYERTQVVSAVRAFLGAQRPLIFAGNGIKTSRLSETFREWTSLFQVPVLVDSHARGILGEGHPWLFGTFGLAAPESTHEALERYQPDAVLFLGTRLGETATLNWSSSLMNIPLKVHVDLDSAQLNKVTQTQFPIQMRLEDFFPIALEVRGEQESKKIPFVGGEEYATTNQIPAHKELIHPRELMSVLDFYLPENAIILSDIGNTMAWALRHLRIRQRQEFFVPIGLGAMGSSLCASIGIKSRFPERPVVVLSGDCSTLMHGNELWTAVNAKLGVKWIILNDSGHGMVDQGMKMIGYPDGVRVRFERPMDFVKFAESMGVPAYRATSLASMDQLPWEKMMTSTEPTLIELKVDPSPLPPIGARHRILGMTEIKNK